MLESSRLIVRKHLTSYCSTVAAWHNPLAMTLTNFGLSFAPSGVFCATA
jgi:hypothetical protein